MSRKPLVAVVGRPNTGKSTLFNYLIGQRKSIVDAIPGITRDRIYGIVEWCGHFFELIDTGGIEINSGDNLINKIKMQAEYAINEANVIMLVLDGKAGIMPEDKEILKLLRKTGKCIIGVVNKLENPAERYNLHEFHSLGLKYLIDISAQQGLNLGDMLDMIVENLPETDSNDSDEEITQIAVVGKPNAGKSSLINKLIGEDKILTDNKPGTTRDSIDTPIEYNGRPYILIDTAGMRRKSQIKEVIEKYSVIRALRSIQRCDVVIHVIDVLEGITDQDSKILSTAVDSGKGLIIVINKWDLNKGDIRNHENQPIIKDQHIFRQKLLERFPFIDFAPVVFTSALTGKNTEKIFEEAERVAEERKKQIPTSMLNDLIEDFLFSHQAPSRKGKKLKIYYSVQTGSTPPTFTFFTNQYGDIHFSFERFIKNRLRESLGFYGNPIKLIFRSKTRRDPVDGQ